MRYLIGGTRASLNVRGIGDTGFHLYLPKYGSPANVAEVLDAINPQATGQGTTQAGEVMSDFIAAIRPAVRCRLMRSELQADYHYTVTLHVRGVDVVVKHNNVTTVFTGPVSEFITWASKQTGLDHLALKTVKFRYNGGSKPGQFRTVRVNKVWRQGSNVTIEGVDLDTEDLREGFRRYHSQNIQGEIEILN